MPSGIKVKSAMKNRVVTITQDKSVLAAAKLMKKEDIGSLVVVEKGRPIGIMTREDINDKVAAKDLRASKLLVKQIMSAPVVSCSSEDDITAISQIMSKYGFERLPVIDKGKLLGIISTREVVKVAPAAIEVFRQHFEEESAPVIGKSESSDGDECERCSNYSDDLKKIRGVWVCSACREEEGIEE
jgi:CBS domain-containing protein